MSKRRYRKISVWIWNDAKFMALSHDAKLIVFFMLTHPALTQIGALRANVPGLACELGMDLEVFSKGFKEVLAQGIVKHDTKLLIWFPNFLKYNPPESPNVVKSWHYGYNELPESQLKADILEGVKGIVDGLSQGFREAFTKTFAEDLAQGFPNQRTESREQRAQEESTNPFNVVESTPVDSVGKAGEQEREAASFQESTSQASFAYPEGCTDSSTVPSSSAPLTTSQQSVSTKHMATARRDSSQKQHSTCQGIPSSNQSWQQSSELQHSASSQQGGAAQHAAHDKNSSSVQPCPYVQLQALYNKICTRLPQCRDMTAQRKSRLKSVWGSASKRQTLSWWEEFFTLVDKSDFLSGNNDRGWTANFDWILKPANMVKIEEGSYQTQRVKSSSKPVSKAAFVTANNQAVYEAMMQKG